MEIKILDYDFSICKIEDYSGVTLESEFFFLGKTDEECSLVCPTKRENFEKAVRLLKNAGYVVTVIHLLYLANEHLY